MNSNSYESLDNYINYKLTKDISFGINNGNIGDNLSLSKDKLKNNGNINFLTMDNGRVKIISNSDKNTKSLLFVNNSEFNVSDNNNNNLVIQSGDKIDNDFNNTLKFIGGNNIDVKTYKNYNENIVEISSNNNESIDNILNQFKEEHINRLHNEVGNLLNNNGNLINNFSELRNNMNNLNNNNNNLNNQLNDINNEVNNLNNKINSNLNSDYYLNSLNDYIKVNKNNNEFNLDFNERKVEELILNYREPKINIKGDDNINVKCDENNNVKLSLKKKEPESFNFIGDIENGNINVSKNDNIRIQGGETGFLFTDIFVENDEKKIKIDRPISENNSLIYFDKEKYIWENTEGITLHKNKENVESIKLNNSFLHNVYNNKSSGSIVYDYTDEAFLNNLESLGLGYGVGEIYKYPCSNRSEFNYGDFVMLNSESEKVFEFIKFNNNENKMNQIFGIVVKNPGIDNNNENCIYLIKKGITLLSLSNTKNIKLGSSLISSNKGKTNKCCVTSLENILLKKSEENNKREYNQFVGTAISNIINKSFILVDLDLKLLLV